MPSSDHCLERPWMAIAVHGVRRSFQWPAPFLKRIRTRFTIVYWNPTPGAVVTTGSHRHVLNKENLLLIPAGVWFQRSNLRPFDHWWCHLYVNCTCEGDHAHEIVMGDELKRQRQAILTHIKRSMACRSWRWPGARTGDGQPTIATGMRIELQLWLVNGRASRISSDDACGVSEFWGPQSQNSGVLMSGV